MSENTRKRKHSKALSTEALASASTSATGSTLVAVAETGRVTQRSRKHVPDVDVVVVDCCDIYYTSSSRKSIQYTKRLCLTTSTVHNFPVITGVTIGTIKNEIRRRHIVFDDTLIALQVYSGHCCALIENEPANVSTEQQQYELLLDDVQWDVNHHGGSTTHPLIVEVGPVKETTVQEQGTDCDNCKDGGDEDENGSDEDEDEDANKRINRDNLFTTSDENLISFGKDKDWIIAKQKIRAIDHWEKAVQLDNKLGAMSGQIIALLNEGKVPPYFHAFSAGEANYLFPTGTKVGEEELHSDEIQLSAENVQAGSSVTDGSSDGRIARYTDASYLPAFFDESGCARYKVHDATIQADWEFNKEYTDVVADLVNANAEMVGEDVEITNLSKLFPTITGEKKMITRCLSRGVVRDCYSNINPENTFAIVGNPGIGKSWTLLYALQQALLYENACVMIVFQKRDFALVCIRRNNTVYAWATENSECKTSLNWNSNVLVLLDPSDIDGAKFSMGRRRLIYAASNNTKHFRHHLEKENDDYDKTLSPYSDKELVVAIQHMLPNVLSDEDLRVTLQRRNVVGNLPRYILTEKRFNKRKNATETTINTMHEKVIVDVLKYFSGVTKEDPNDPNKVSIPGALFSILAESQDNNYGYDGQMNVKYEERVIGLMSKSVEDFLLHKYRDPLLECFTYKPDFFSALGMRLEQIFSLDMKVGRQMRTYMLPVDDKIHFEMLSFDSQDDSDIINPVLPICTIPDLNVHVFSESNVICQMQINTPTIDFAGPGRKVYQVTISKTKHFSSLKGLTELFIASGHLVKNEENRLVRPAENPPILQFYWVIPYYIESHWTNKKPITIRGSDAALQKVKGKGISQRSLLKSVLDDCVQQYVLVLDTDSTLNKYVKISKAK